MANANDDSVDVDAVANWINTCDGSPQNPTNVSRGVYGATVGIDRLLKLYDKYDIKCTFFTPVSQFMFC